MGTDWMKTVFRFSIIFLVLSIVCVIITDSGTPEKVVSIISVIICGAVALITLVITKVKK